MRGTTVILANGDFPQTEKTLTVLREAKRIVCCDGAANNLLKTGLEATCVIGDLDSLSLDLKQHFADRLIHIREQETNDLSKAFRYCCRKGWRNIVILGATGKREDHTLGNVSLLADYAQIIPSIRMITDHGSFQVLTHSARINCSPGQQISIFAVDPDTRITSTGLKYPMKDFQIKMWWQATLNEALSSDIALTFTPGKRLLLFLAD